MSDLKLDNPVYSIDNKLLLPAGTILTDEILNKLTSSNKRKFRKKSLLEYRQIEKDIIKYFNQDNYHVIFLDNEITEMILKYMESVILPLPVLKTIYYFKKYDNYCYRHMLMVFALSTLLAIDLLKDTDKIMYEIIASPTHDIGKIAVAKDILQKETPLTRSELKKLHHHVLTGYILLCYYFQDKENLAARIARDHHERRDGKGYPSGIHINDLMIEIVIVTDIFDALISPRSYRPESYDIRTALDEITELAKLGKISMNIVKALIRHHRKNKPHIDECIVSDKKRGTPPLNNLYGIIIPNNNK